MKTYMNVEPNSVEKAAKTFSYLKKLKKNFLLQFPTQNQIRHLLILNADDQVDLQLLAVTNPLHFVQSEQRN